jgi:hypothetical protein
MGAGGGSEMSQPPSASDADRGGVDHVAPESLAGLIGEGIEEALTRARITAVNRQQAEPRVTFKGPSDTQCG